MNRKLQPIGPYGTVQATNVGRRRFIAGLGASAAIVSSGSLMRPARAQATLNVGVLLPTSGRRRLSDSPASWARTSRRRCCRVWVTACRSG